MEQDNQIELISDRQATNYIENATAATTIILDFDETLLLRNSTAEYINSLRPRLIGFILIAVLKIIRPWVWLPQPWHGNKVKDWFLVVVPTILLPWTWWLWQKRASELAANYGNSELITAVNNNLHSPIIVASLGFNFIIHPILKHLPIRYTRLVGCRFWQGAKDRGKGKLLMMQEVLEESAIKAAIVVTDSEDDLPLLEIVARPCFVVWSSAKYIHPFQDFWLSSWLRRSK